MKLDETLYNFAFSRALQKPAMLMKIRGSDESFRRRMWKKIEKADSDHMDNMTEVERKKIYLELKELQHEAELKCLTFDSWESGREELKISLLTEQNKVGDILYMKYGVQRPIFEQATSESKFKDEKDVRDFMATKTAIMNKAQKEQEK